MIEGTLLAGRYEVDRKVGAGGMSDVYRAKDLLLGRNVAIKMLKQEFSEDRNFVSKFRTEAQSAAGLEHPNIVNIYDVGIEEGMYYIVMEYVDGITLKTYIEKKGQLNFKESVSIAIQVARGIEAAHNKDIIHRDIKPQNIIISSEGKVKVTDFGIARAASANTISSDVMGSVHYASPEQARNGFVDERSDIYSLGIVMYEMITGRVPFDGETTVAVAIQHLQDEMVPPSKYAPDIPKSFEMIIRKCTQKSQERRYQNIGEVMADLRHSLVDPDGDFVVIPPLFDSGKTRVIKKEEVREIRKYEAAIRAAKLAKMENLEDRQDSRGEGKASAGDAVLSKASEVRNTTNKKHAIEYTDPDDYDDLNEEDLGYDYGEDEDQPYDYEEDDSDYDNAYGAPSGKREKKTAGKNAKNGKNIKKSAEASEKIGEDLNEVIEDASDSDKMSRPETPSVSRPAEYSSQSEAISPAADRKADLNMQSKAEKPAVKQQGPADDGYHSAVADDEEDSRDYAEDDLGDEEYTDDDPGDEEYADDDYDDEEYADEDFDDEDYSDEDFDDEDYDDDDLDDEDYAEDDLDDEDYAEDDPDTEDYTYDDAEDYAVEDTESERHVKDKTAEYFDSDDYAADEEDVAYEYEDTEYEEYDEDLYIMDDREPDADDDLDFLVGDFGSKRNKDKKNNTRKNGSRKNTALQQQTKGYAKTMKTSGNKRRAELFADDNEEDTAWINPRLNKGVTIMGLLCAIGLVVLVLYLIGGVFGLFRFSGKGEPQETGQTSEEKVEMISILGDNYKDAEKELKKMGLTLNVEDIRESDRDEGTVIQQDYKEGDMVEVGTEIQVVIAGVNPVEIPNVVGYNETTAAQTLASANLTTQKSFEYSTTVPEGTVISQDPESGKVTQGTVVKLVISQGSETESVPTVVGKSEDYATSSLVSAGFRVNIKYSYSNTVNNGFVIKQSPEGGKNIQTGKTVTITVSQGPKSKAGQNQTTNSETESSESENSTEPEQ